MQTDLHTLTYFSRNAIEHNGGDLNLGIERILLVSRRNNSLNGVTGALLYSGGCFAQVLEGQLSAVERIFEAIERDPRHRDVTVLHFQQLETRLFGEWSMAYAGVLDPATTSLNISGVLESPNRIENVAAGQHLIAVMHDLINKHELRPIGSTTMFEAVI